MLHDVLPSPPMRNVTFAVPGSSSASRTPSPSVALDSSSSPASAAAIVSQPPGKEMSAQAPRQERPGRVFARPAPPERSAAASQVLVSTSPRSTTLTLLPTVTSQRSTPASPGSASSQRASLATPEVPAPQTGRFHDEGQSGASAPIQVHDAAVEPRRPPPPLPPFRSLAHPTQDFFDVDGGRPLEEPAPSPPECTQCGDLNWQLSIVGEEIERLDQSRARALETIASLEAKVLEGERTV